MTTRTGTKERLHRLVDELPRNELRAAERFLLYLRNMGSDPLARALEEAPFDDEPETADEAAAVREAKEDLAAGRVLTHEEARLRLLGQP